MSTPLQQLTGTLAETAHSATHQIGSGLSHLAYRSKLYNVSLNCDVPQGLLIKPVDPWPGNAEFGRWLSTASAPSNTKGVPKQDPLNPMPLPHADVWHSFAFLRDLRAAGGPTARRQARLMVEGWIVNYNQWNEEAWRIDLTGERVSLWIALYDFFAESADDHFQYTVLHSLGRQAKHLARTLPASSTGHPFMGLPILKAIKGLIYAGLALPDHERWLSQGINALTREIETQVLSDGGHISKSPDITLEVLKLCVDLRSALHQARYPCPEALVFAIDRLGQAVRVFRYPDKNFALFNGGAINEASVIDSVLAQAGVKGKTLSSLPHTGYERVASGRGVMMVDVGNIPPRGFDLYAHTAPLAFEFSHGKDRIFSNCGSPAMNAGGGEKTQKWRRIVRSAGAHNTLTIDRKNIGEIHKAGYIARRPENITCQRVEKDGQVLLGLSHDGYKDRFGIIHHRRLYLGSDGLDLRGEELLLSDGALELEAPLEVTVRFHIHPTIQAMLLQGGEALLRMPNGLGWRFRNSGAELALEDSISFAIPEDRLNPGTPRKGQQLVLRTKMHQPGQTIKWALKGSGV